MKSTAKKSIQLVASTVAGLAWAGVSLAQTWNLNGNGNWGVAGNWTPALVPNGIGTSASLLNIITAPRTVSLNVPVTLGNLTFGGNFAYTIGGTNTLTFDVAAGNAEINVGGAAAHTISRPIVLNDTLVINQSSTGALTLSGARSGIGGLIKNGTGQVTLNGVGSFTGQTRINEGTVLYNAAGAIPAASLVTVGDSIGVAGSAVLNLNAAMSAAQALNVTLASDGVVVQNNNRLVRFSAVSGTGELRLNSAVGNAFEATGTGGDTTFSGTVTGGIALNSAAPNTGSRFIKTGAATLTLDGNNTYVARTFINGGSLRAASNAALGAASAGFDNATFVYSTGSLQLSNDITLAERIYLNGTGGGAGALRNFSGDNTITGNVTLGWTGTGVGSAAASIGADAGTTLAISGNIDGAQSLTKVGDGLLVLSGNNTWSGATIVNAGTLQLGAATGMATTVLTVNGGTFDLNGFSKTVNTLSGTGGAIELGAGALTVNQLAARTYAGVISGSGSLAKTGAGTLTLTGANTYTGGTTVSAGTLQGNSTSLQGNIVNNAIVAFNQTAAGTYAGAMSGTGRLTKSGAGTLVLTGANNYTGGTTMTAGTLQGSTTSLQGNIAASGSAVIFDQAVAGTYAGVMSGNASLTKTGAGTLTLTGANSYSGGTRLNGGTVAVASDARLGTGGLTFNGGALQTLAALTSAKAVSLLGAGTIDTNGFTSTFSGAITGAGSLVKTGAGTLTLTGNNTFSGGSTVTAGTLQGNTTSLRNTIVNNAAVTFNQTAAGTYAGVMSGTGALTKMGAGTLTLSGANTYSGGTSVNAGILSGNSTSLQGNIVNSTTVNFNQAAAGTYAGSISGTGVLTKSGAGTLVLTGANTHTGGTTVSAGTLQGNTTSLQGNIVANNSAVTFDQAATGTYAGAMSGNASLTKMGAGTLTLTGANSYTGGTRFNGGSIAVASDARLGTGALTFNGGALQTLAAFNSTKAVSLLGVGTIDTNGFAANLSGAITGVGSLVKDGAGTLTVTGANTYSGGTTVSSGTLQGNTTSLQNTIVNNAAVIFNQTGAGTYAGAMSGTGSLTKIGAGTLTLSGANTYSGGTTVNVGTLQGTTTNLQGDIVNNAAVIFNQGAAGTYAGVMSGTGSLTKIGVGILTMSGANTYVGGTAVSAGTLQGSTTSLQGNIVNNASVVFDQAMAGTYAGAMSGTGSLTKNNAGTLTLTGTNTHSGGTTINAGTVAVASETQLGTGDLTFNGGALQTTATFASAKTVTLTGAGTIDTNGFAATLIGLISGSGALTKAGAGVLTLTGANTYAGGTTVSTGALQGNSTSLQGTIVNNAAVVFDQTATGTYAGVMSGTGTLTKNSAGTLILSGANTYAGGTAVSAGTLQGDSTSLQGNIANNAAVVFDQAGTGTYTGEMSGSGSLMKNNVGTLILTAANTYSGGTTVNGGTLQGSTASLQGNIVNNSSVVFDQNTDGTYSAAMSGTGALTKLGSGNLTLVGVNAFSGPTAVNAGTLTVLGSMTSNLALAGGATLSGNGIVGGINAAAGSIVAPGRVQSTLTANGAYMHSDGAIFRVHADATGASSRLKVNGAATLEGGTVDVQAQDGNYAPATRYTILNASAGVGGMFSSVTSNLAFLTPTLEYDPTNVFLTLARNGIGFAEVASTANQRQVSNAFDRATAADATGDIATVIDGVTALSAPQARSAYESMGGLVHTLLPTIGIADVNHFNRATASRLRARTEGAAGTGLAWSGIKLASAQSPHSDAPALFASTGGSRGFSDATSRNVWLSGYGLDGDLDGDTSSGKYDYRISGLIIGIDTDIDRNWTGGLSAAYSDWRVRNDGRGDRSDAKAYRIGGYGRFSDGPIRVDGVVGYGNVDYETDRRIVFGTINRTAHADYSGEQFTANVVGRYRIEQGHYGIEPFAALQYVLESQDGFVEAGADSVNLTVASRTLKSTRGTLGARVDRAFDTAGGTGLVEIRAGYSREFSGVPNISASFIGDPTQTGLGIFAENFDRDSWLAGAGVSFAPQKNLTMYVDVNGDFQSQGTLVSVMGGMRFSW